MNRRLISFALIIITTIVSGCKDDVDPLVETYYFKDSSAEEMRSKAFFKLYEFYTQSDKTKEYYEVIAQKQENYIINYNPSGQLLTVCTDPGSGWSDQIRNVNENELKRIVDQKISLDSLRSFVHKDSLLESVSPMIQVKTNGNPSL